MTEVIAYTKYGKIRGDYDDGVYRFLGVRYAKAPVGALRFQPPVEPDVSDLVIDCREYAKKCWQTDTPRIEVPEVANSPYNRINQRLVTGNMEMGKGPQSEDCLALNIWTPDLTEGMNLPVMVWCHGGGNLAGSGDCPHQDGFRMAKKNGVVMVSFNHRLSLFGYMDLAHYGVEKFSKCRNLGNQDMVAVLKWIHDNIQWFGVDPENVTIFGESGGGKVCQLLGMPSAKGLFHKAIVQSGGFQTTPVQDGIEDTEAFLSHLGIGKDNLDLLETIPPQDLIRAMREVNAGRENGNYLNFPTTFDGEVIRYNPFDGAEGSEYCKDIPLIICYTKEDMALIALFNPEIFELTEEQLPKKLQECGYSAENCDTIIRIYREMLGEQATAAEIFIALMNDNAQLRFVDNVSKTKDGKGGANFYNCVFGFESPDPIQKAIHGIDVPFFFDNAYLAPCLYTAKNKAAAFAVSDTCGSAWAAFARTGDPTGRNMPAWLPYDQKNRYTMMFKENSELIPDYHRKGREFITAVRGNLPGFGRIDEE